MPMQRVFLSYGTEDGADLADRLEADLAGPNREVWRDRSEIKGGDDWQHRIAMGLAQSDAVVFLMTPHAVRPGGVCGDEIALPRDRGVPVIPLMVEECEPLLRVRSLSWLDFTAPEREAHYAATLAQLEAALADPRSPIAGMRAGLLAKLKPLDFSELTSRLTLDFTGREWLLAEFDRWLESSDSRVFYLTGDPGIGKSALLARIGAEKSRIAPSTTP